MTPHIDTIVQSLQGQSGKLTEEEYADVIKRAGPVWFDDLLVACCHEALRQMGKRFQVNMMIEEASEWAVEGARWQRDGAGREDRQNRSDGILEETADAKVMARQMEVMFGEKAIDEIYRRKILRLAFRLLPGVDQPGHYDEDNHGTRVTS